MHLLTLIFIAFLISTGTSVTQSFTTTHALQGYAVFGDQSTFIFDEEVYAVQPDKVVVTGAFRGWDQNMNVPQWDLKKTGSQWVLTFDNENLGFIASNTPFKFRINDGEWMDPPADAPNNKDGNLIFSLMEITKGLKVEIRSDALIWADIIGERPLKPDAYRITMADGTVIPVKEVIRDNERSTFIVPSETLDKRRVYYLEIPDLELKAWCRYDGWFRDLRSSKELGANVEDGKTAVRLGAPRADLIRLHLYRGRLDSTAYEIIEMEVDDEGVWEALFDEDLHGVYYDFTIHGPQDPGNMFYETHPVHFTDPYARVSDDTWGKARIWRATTPATPLENGIPAMEDVIAYEVHVQDFTDRLPVEDKYKGRFKAMHTPGLANSNGQKIGIDYIVDLGINVLHLMPVQEYLHFPTDDWKASFKDDPYMIDQGVSEENYQWGYRTTHAFAVEAHYRTKGAEPGEEREEFRNLVQAYHDKGIAVIIDIVPNHTGENMDGNGWLFNFNAIDKQYYYRTKDFEHIGAYGNEVKTENRPMVKRWLIDQCQHWIDEFGIDGFRIDLAGQIDQQSLIALKEALGPEIIVYGEAWIGSNDPEFEANPEWDWYKADAPITFFQDDSRNAFKGPVFELNNPKTDRGWPGGKNNERDNVMKGLANKFPDDDTPVDGISYLDIHDNFALADQFGYDFDGRYNVDEELYKVAATLLYTSLGPIVTHGGSEIMRSKAHAPLGEVVKTTDAGYKIYMHGYRDTYNHRTANQFDWESVGQKPTAGNFNDYENMHAFWRGLNRFRLSEYGEVFRVSEPVDDNYYTWLLPEKESQLGYMVNGKVLVLLNPGEDIAFYPEVQLPDGNWRLIGMMDRIDVENGVRHSLMKDLEGGQAYSLSAEPRSLWIWVKD